MNNRRSLSQIVKALFGKQHYIALWNMLLNYPSFFNILFHYLTGYGRYPSKISIRTPVGLISPTLYSHHDLLTVNEIFCRQDYKATHEISIVVDLGSNIGISALYWLTRNRTSKCYLYEPDERNIIRLKQNLAGFEDRYVIHKNAVSDQSGKLEFGTESTGRYGGLGMETGNIITVDCLDINSVIENVFQQHHSIDILKIDTEGVEVRTVTALKPSYAEKIKRIYIEAEPETDIHPDIFLRRQYGSVCKLSNIR